MSEEVLQGAEGQQAENVLPLIEEKEAENTGRRNREKREFHIEIFKAWCKSCGICEAFCPRHCIGRDDTGSPVVTVPERCTGCGWCELHCPDFAISVRQENGNGPKQGREEERE